jgi:multiple sugar transport system permease protein
MRESILVPSREARHAQKRYRRHVRNTRTAKRIIAHLVLAIGGLVMIMPLFWLVSSSLKRPEQIFVFPPQLIPNPAHWSNYVRLFEVTRVALYASNTLRIAIVATAGQVLTSAVAAYAFARIRFPGRDLVFGVLLTTLMLPFAVLMIPTYVMFARIGWVGTFLPLTVPYWFGGGVFNIFLLRQFMRTIPKELDEAAVIDGASRFRIFFTIILPLCRPALTVVTINSFLHHWNDFLAPLIFLTNSRQWTLALAIASLRDMGYGLDTTHYMLALSTIVVTPVVILYFLAQRAFIRGIALTGIKG